MSFSEGVYSIRFVPPHIKFPFLGGAYATAEATNAPILAHGMNPTVPGDQDWRIRPVDGKKDTYTIITHPGHNVDPKPVLPGFGLGTKRRSYNDNILLTMNIAEWVITVVDVENQVFTISEPSTMVGATKCIDNHHGVLILATFPVVQDMPPLPRWQITKNN